MRFPTIIGEAGTGAAVTLWIPVRVWPVVSLTILDRLAQETVWLLLNTGLDDAYEAVDSRLEIQSVTVSPSKHVDQNELMSGLLPLRYGEPPVGMYQRIPNIGFPAALRKDTEYLVAVRDAWDSALRRFLLELQF